MRDREPFFGTLKCIFGSFFFRTSHIDSHELMKKFADSDFIKKVPKYAKVGVDHVYKTVSDLEISLNKKAHFDVKFVWNPCQFFFLH